MTVNHLVPGSTPGSGASVMGNWYSWEHSSFASFSRGFDPPILHQVLSECRIAWFIPPALGAGGPRFESLYSDQYFCEISSVVEQGPYKAKVGSSTLSSRTKISDRRIMDNTRVF